MTRQSAAAPDQESATSAAPQFQHFQNLQYLGKLQNRRSTAIPSSKLGVGFECLDRGMWEPNQAWSVLEELGVKWARVQTGWAKTESKPGRYDFAWLDTIVNKLIERGVQPWFSISYGNPVYTREMNTAPAGSPPKLVTCGADGVGFPPIHTPTERQAWQNYVRALVRHFRDRVTHYEVWNEPDLLSFWKCQPKAADYVDLVRLTAAPLREEQPDAKLIGGAIAWGMTVWSLKFFEDCMEAGLHELIDIVTYHGYKSVPERHSAQEIATFTHLINKYKSSLAYWQGEAGVQSYVPEKARGVGALSTMRSSEAIQARMLLRRSLLELANGCAMTSYFHMADFAHYVSCKETFHYGLLRLADGSPKPAFYALQSLCTLLSDPLEPATGRTACHMSVLDDTRDPRATKAFTWHANFVRGNVPVHAWWFPESVEDDPVVKPMEMTYWMDRDLRLENPVLIEPVTQEVYAVQFEMDQRTCAETWMVPDPEAEGVRVFQHLPISNSPLLLTDRSIVEIRYMKITAIKPLLCYCYRTNWVFVKVMTDAGLHGVGEATLEYREQTVAQAVRELERMLIGRDPHDIEAIWHDAYRDVYWRGGPVLMSALSGVEMALWDIKGKALNVPVYQLFGGKCRDRIPCYANGWFAPATTPAAFAAKAKETVNAGFKGLKWDPFGSAWQNITKPQLKQAQDCIQAVVDAVGDQIDILIEAHGRFNIPTAVRIGHMLEEFDVLWFEEPIPPDNKEGLAEVKRRVRVPIAAGERLYSRYDYREFFRLGCADFVQPDVSHAGGIGEVRKIGAMAECHHIPCCPHNPSGPVANAATLQLAACMPNFAFLETMSTDVSFRHELSTEQVQIVAGEMLIPDRPGLGLELNEEAVAHHPFQPVNLRHYDGTLTDVRPPDAVHLGK